MSEMVDIIIGLFTFKGKFLYHLNALYQSGVLNVPTSFSGQPACGIPQVVSGKTS